MARKRKPSGRLNAGPFTAAQVKAALKLLGGVERPGGGHQKVYEHPIKGWKVPVSESWTGLRKSCPILKGIARTTGVRDKDLLELLNRV